MSTRRIIARNKISAAYEKNAKRDADAQRELVAKRKLKWISEAHWPEGTCDSCHNITKDNHDTIEQAYGVKKLLQAEGFGGERKVFPVCVRIYREDSSIAALDATGRIAQLPPEKGIWKDE